jgi:hypothetical protein
MVRTYIGHSLLEKLQVKEELFEQIMEPADCIWENNENNRKEISSL